MEPPSPVRPVPHLGSLNQPAARWRQRLPLYPIQHPVAEGTVTGRVSDSAFSRRLLAVPRGVDRSRTCNILVANQALYHWSYYPVQQIRALSGRVQGLLPPRTCISASRDRDLHPDLRLMRPTYALCLPSRSVPPPGFEPESRPSQGRVVPLYYEEVCDRRAGLAFAPLTGPVRVTGIEPASDTL